tara:strand:+ start:147 stop:2291 length:2145 start_codon:yes stop_codon:yes gene_type:complete
MIYPPKAALLAAVSLSLSLSPGLLLADAEEAALEEIVVTTTAGLQIPVSSIPGAVQILDREDLDIQNAISQDLADTLANLLPGYSPSNQLASNFGQTFRGKKAVVLIDGVLQTTPIRNASREFRTISQEAIERVEVIKGASALYGNGYAGGVINIVTKQATEDFQGWASGEYNFQPEDWGTTDGYALNAGFSGTTGGQLEVVLSASYVKTGHFVDAHGEILPDDQNGQGGTANGNQYDVLLKLGRQFDTHRLEISGHYYYMDNRPSFNRIVNPLTGFTEIDVTRPYSSGDPKNESFFTRLQWQSDDLFGQEFALHLSFGKNDYLFATTKVESRKIKISPSLRSSFAEGDLQLIYGLDMEWDTTSQSYRADFVPDNIPAGIEPCWICDVDKQQISPYLQANYTLTERLEMQAGVRYENYRFDVPDFVPIRGPLFGVPVAGGTLNYNEPVFNIGAVYQLAPATELYGGYSEGYAVDDLRRLRGITTPTVAAFKDQVPATKSHNFELGIRSLIGDDLNLSATAYYTKNTDASHYGQESDGAFPLEFLIYADEKIYGVELTADYRFTDRLSAGGTYSWSEGEYLDSVTGDYRYLNGTRITPAKITAYVEGRPLDNLFARLQMLHVAGRDKFPDLEMGGLVGNLYYESEIDGYTLLDFTMSYSFETRGKLTLSVRNLLNNHYAPASSQVNNDLLTTSAASRAVYAGQGRAISLKYSITY